MSDNQITTITRREKHRIEQKAKAGWKCFFIMRDDYTDLSDYYSQVRSQNRELVKNIKNGQDVDLTFLKKQFVDLYEKVGEMTDCPVCFETLTKEIIEVSNCGHTICKDCYKKCSECPICRKAYYKSSN